MEKDISIYIITGPPAVGISAVTAALAKSFDRSAAVEVDVIRHMIVEDVQSN